MNDPSLDSIERRVSELSLPDVPKKLRGIVLSDVHRQLKAQRWDRRLVRTAALVLGLGVGLNAWVTWRDPQRVGNPVALAGKPDVIVRAGVAVAEATDLATGHQFARHLAALSGKSLTSEQSKAIQQQLKPRRTDPTALPKDG